MKDALRLILAVVLLSGWSGRGSGQEVKDSIAGIPVLTVCEALGELSRHNGQSVVVVGRFGYTDEGSWLSEDCERKIVTDGYTWASSISTAYLASKEETPPDLPKGFTWETKILRAKLTSVQKTTKLTTYKKLNYSDKWVAIFGRFETRLPLQVVDVRGTLRGIGFGHLGEAPAQLISGEKGYHELTAK